MSTTIRAGGYELVSAGGTVTGTAIKDGGYLVLGAGGTASSASVSGGGTMIVSAGGAALDTESAAAAVLSVTNLVTSGQTVSGVTVGSASILAVGSGGQALSTTLAAGGAETVSSGGIASGTVVSSGATLNVLAGGSAVGAIVDSGGTFILLSGGSATGTVTSSGALGSVKLVVGNGQVSSGLAANSVTSVYVLSGGVASAMTVASGGSAVVEPLGQDVGTVVSAGGFELVSGISVNAVVSGGATIMGGMTSGLTVAGSGSVGVVNAPLGFSVLSNTTITGQGNVTVAAGTLSNVTITGNGLLMVAAGDEVSGSVVFGGGGSFIISSTVMPFATLSAFTSTNTLDLASVPFSSSATTNFSDDSLVITEGGQNYILQFGGTYTNDVFSIAAAPISGTLVQVVDPPPCFVAGTLIATPQGEVAVERLSCGDLVLTEGSGAAPITWIGFRRVDCNRHTDATRIWPVLIRADAFAPSLPKRDLLLSPDHAIFAAGVLIPVKHLVNGRSIVQVAVEEVTYFHLELAQHAVILAEGLAVESYLDTGDRSAFTGTRAPRMLHAAFGSERADIGLVMEALGCAPLRVTGPEVEQIRATLARRSKAEAEAEAGPRGGRRPRRRERREP
jgi:autotransporter passenger strand-loop-strand repeat protein